jgi:hypothetical protein
MPLLLAAIARPPASFIPALPVGFAPPETLLRKPFMCNFFSKNHNPEIQMYENSTPRLDKTTGSFALLHFSHTQHSSLIDKCEGLKSTDCHRYKRLCGLIHFYYVYITPLVSRTYCQAVAAVSKRGWGTLALPQSKFQRWCSVRKKSMAAGRRFWRLTRIEAEQLMYGN